MTRQVDGILSVAVLALAACGGEEGLSDSLAGSESPLDGCSLTITKNTYDGPNYWGTLSVKNGGTASLTGLIVEFDLPGGAHCTNDAVPSGAKLSPLSGSGPSAHTVASHCKFTWASATLKAGASKTFNYSSDAQSFNAALNVLPSSPSCGGSGGGGTTLDGVYITWYGFNDNSCQIESEHDCNTIAFPKSDGFPVRHNIATEGAGTHDDPVTFATAADDSGNNAEFAPGTIIYVPLVRKYFIMEDQCKECDDEWRASRSFHVDLWMGPSYGSANDPLMACEERLTRGEPYHGAGRIIVNAPAGFPVDTTRLFINDTCTAHAY